MSSTFSPETWGVLDRLEAANAKATFDAVRDTYQAEVAGPSAALVEQLAPLLAEQVHPDLQGEPKVGRSLFRINRDTRFSKDKTPYKTHLDLLFWIEGDGDEGPVRERPACILRITSTTVLLGAGQMGLRGEALDRYRSRVDDEQQGAALAEIVAARLDAGDELSDPDRARVPKPYPADHPRADLLRHDGFHLSATRPHPASITTTRFPQWCATRLAVYGPLLTWLAER